MTLTFFLKNAFFSISLSKPVLLAHSVTRSYNLETKEYSDNADKMIKYKHLTGPNKNRIINA